MDTGSSFELSSGLPFLFVGRKLIKLYSRELFELTEQSLAYMITMAVPRHKTALFKGNKGSRGFIKS